MGGYGKCTFCDGGNRNEETMLVLTHHTRLAKEGNGEGLVWDAKNSHRKSEPLTSHFPSMQGSAASVEDIWECRGHFFGRHNGGIATSNLSLEVSNTNILACLGEFLTRKNCPTPTPSSKALLWAMWRPRIFLSNPPALPPDLDAQGLEEGARMQESHHTWDSHQDCPIAKPCSFHKSG